MSKYLLPLLVLLLPACYTAPRADSSPNVMKPDAVFYRDYCQLCSHPWDSHLVRCPNVICRVQNGATNGGPCPRCQEPWPPGMTHGPCPVCDSWFEVGPVVPGFGYSNETEERYLSGNKADPPL